MGMALRVGALVGGGVVCMEGALVGSKVGDGVGGILDGPGFDGALTGALEGGSVGDSVGGGLLPFCGN